MIKRNKITVRPKAQRFITYNGEMLRSSIVISYFRLNLRTRTWDWKVKGLNLGARHVDMFI